MATALSKLIVRLTAVLVLVLLAPVLSSCAATDQKGQSDSHMTWSDEFDAKAVDTKKWAIYDGPGNEEKGVRRPTQVTEQGGAVTITCTTNGVCGALMARQPQKYGTWAARVRATPASANIHPVLLLWPPDNVWPGHGEVDYMEAGEPTRQSVDGFLHFGTEQIERSVGVDLTQWHVFSVTWTPQAITYYVDGRPWFQDTDPTHQPPLAMNPTIQLDYTGGPISQGGSMTVDWLRIYSR